MPYPTTAGLPTPGSTFTPAAGAERRFSVRFMTALPQKLQLAGVSPELAGAIKARFETFGRSGIDKVGPAFERLLSGPHAKLAAATWEAMQGLHTAVLPGGHTASPNHEGSWTISPAGQDPFVLEDKPGAKATLPGGVTVEVSAKGVLAAGEQTLERAISIAAQGLQGASTEASLTVLSNMLEKLQASKTSALSTTVSTMDSVAGKQAQTAATVGLITATVVTVAVATVVFGAVAAAPLVAAAGVSVVAAIGSASLTVIQNSPALQRAAALVLREAGMGEVAKLLEGSANATERFLAQESISTTLVVGLVMCAVVAQVARAPVEGARQTIGLLEQSGRSAAPSRRADPDAERAVLLLQLAMGGGAGEGLATLEKLAKAIRGQARDAVLR